MSEISKMLSTSCGLIEGNKSDDEPNCLPPAASSPIAVDPLRSLSMESRTIQHCDAVDNNDTCIYYNCYHFKSKFEEVRLANDIRPCNGLLHRTLSCKDMYEARNIIFEFLEARTPNSMCVYGASSWGMVGHGLYFDVNNNLYGYYSGSFGLTIYKMEKSFIKDMYDDNDERLTKIDSMTF